MLPIRIIPALTCHFQPQMLPFGIIWHIFHRFFFSFYALAFKTSTIVQNLPTIARSLWSRIRTASATDS